MLSIMIHRPTNPSIVPGALQDLNSVKIVVELLQDMQKACWTNEV